MRRDVPLDHPDFGRLFPCACRRAQFDADRYQRLTRLSNLGHLQDVTFERLAPQATADGRAPNLVWQSALEVAKRYAESPRGWLVIEGPPGSGKTRLAAAIATRCIAAGLPCLFLPVADLLDHLRGTYAPSSEVAYDELFDQIRNVPLLILDDLGTESATPWAREKLSQLLGHRYNAAAPTVITTDVPLDKLDERIRSRLADPTLSRLVRLATPAGQVPHGIDQLDLVLPHMTFQNFDPDGLELRGDLRENLREAWKLAQRFAEHPEGWLVFLGSPGCGKTHLAAAIANVCRRRGDDVLFLLVPKLLDYLRSLASQPGGAGFEAIDRVERTAILVLDDFGEAVDTPWVRDKLDQILSYRSLTRLPTVITSSLAPERVDARVWSRLDDRRFSIVYQIKAPDYRTGLEKSPARPPDAGRPRGRPRGARDTG